MIPREKKYPRDYQVMDNVLNRGDAVELARLLSVSPQHVRSWCRAPETEDEFATGRFGPLARIRTLISMIRDDDGVPDRAFPVAQYVAQLCKGTFVPDLQMTESIDSDIVRDISAVFKETGEAIEATRTNWFERNGKITEQQKARCRKEINEALVALLQLRKHLERSK